MCVANNTEAGELMRLVKSCRSVAVLNKTSLGGIGVVSFNDANAV